MSPAVQAKLDVRGPDDEYEQEADRTAEMVMRMPDSPRLDEQEVEPKPFPTAIQRLCEDCDEPPESMIGEGKAQARPAPGGVLPVTSEASATIRQLPGRGQPLSATEREFFEPRFGRDLGQVRLHAGEPGNRAARSLNAKALTLGSDVAFRTGEYRPGESSGRRLLAHELTHVLQQGGGGPARYAQSNPAPEAQSPLANELTHAPFAVQTQHSETEPTRGPNAPETEQPSPAESATSPKLAEAYANFLSYIRIVKAPAAAVSRYYDWLERHRNSPDLLKTTPPELWAQSLRGPEPKRNPRLEHQELFIRLMKERLARDLLIEDREERSRALSSMRRFQDWFEKHKDAEDFLSADPGSVYGQIAAGVMIEEIDRQVRKDVEARRVAERSSPEKLRRRQAKFDQFFALAMRLWGYSNRFPYTIPMPSQGKDVLVTGDPAVQRVMSAMGGELVSWATAHMLDTGYLGIDPKAVLLDLLERGYAEKLKRAQARPLAAEVIDRNEIIVSKALASFGTAVAEGLFVVALVAAFVGAEVITAGQATWILVGIAGASGIRSYLGRREEIERSGYHVSVPDTMLHSAGDVVGVSQLVEGISGERLGTVQRLGSEARSEQLGAGAGSVATLLMGSRAYRSGEALGIKLRAPKRGTTPTGPNANTEDVLVPTHGVPPRPTSQAKPGSVEARARALLPDELKVGFDMWMEEIRSGGKGEPDRVLSGMKSERITEVARQKTRSYSDAVRKGEEAEYLRARSRDNPLRPILKNNRREGSIYVHFEGREPIPTEIALGQEIARATGEEIHLFGDTASGISYPGIDGTIGNPPRPLQLKPGSEAAPVNWARYQAQVALEKARLHGYSELEVQISLPGKTVAEVKAAWNEPGTGPTAQPLGLVYEGSITAKLTIRCKDGTWNPPKGPALTGVPLVEPSADTDEERKRQ